MDNAAEEVARLTVHHGEARIWVRLGSPEATAYRCYLVFNLPGPQARTRPSGLILPDAQHPEIELHLAWGELPGAKPLATLHATIAGQTWEFHEDARNPDHWMRDADHGRDWS